MCEPRVDVERALPVVVEKGSTRYCSQTPSAHAAVIMTNENIVDNGRVSKRVERGESSGCYVVEASCAFKPAPKWTMSVLR